MLRYKLISEKSDKLINRLPAAQPDERANILIVDDTRANLRVLVEILTGQSYKVRPASSGRLALLAAQAEPPDLILLDILMPELDGYQVCELLKADDRTRDIPVIFISALSDVFDKMKAFSVGAVDYITKPFQAEEVLARVKTHLTLRRLQQNLEQKNSDLEQEVAERKQTEKRLQQANRQMQRHRQISESLRQAAIALNSSLDQEEVLVKIIEQLGRVVRYNSAALFLRKEDHLVISNGKNLNQVDIGYQISLAGQDPVVRVFRQRQPLVLADVLTEKHWQDWREEERIRSWIGAPLVTGAATIGVLTVDNFEVEAYTGEDAQILQTFAHQAAIAIQNARRVRRTQAALDETRLLYRIGSLLAKTANMQRGIEKALNEYLQALNLQQGSIFLFDLKRRISELKAFCSNGHCQLAGLRIEKIFLAHQKVIDSGLPLVIDDVANDPLMADNRRFMSLYKIKSVLIAPLLVRGKVVGLIKAAATKTPRRFSEGEIRLAQAVADQIAAAVENMCLLDRERRQRQEAESLRQMATALSTSLDEHTVLETVLRELRKVIRYDSAAVFLQQGDHLALVAATDLARPHLGSRLMLAGNAPGARVFKKKKALIIADVHTYPRWEMIWEGLEYIRGWMCVPLVVNDKALGILSVDSFYADAYSEADAQLMQIFANQAAIALENARLFEETQTANISLSKANHHLKTLYERIHDELSFAREIQYGLLPPPRPDYEHIDLVCYSTPAREVGGDFYSYHAFPPLVWNGTGQAWRRFAVAVGDVSGKGVSAALLMAASLSQFDAVLSKDLSPSERLVYLDTTIEPYAKSRQQSCALCYVEITLFSALHHETEQGELHIVNAGCIPPYIRRKNGLVEWPEVGGFALGQGLGEEIGYRETTLGLSKGDLIILTSDGVVEANDAAGEIFGFDRLRQTIAEGPGSSAEAMLTHIRSRLADFMGAIEPHDDLTIVVVQL